MTRNDICENERQKENVIDQLLFISLSKLSRVDIVHLRKETGLPLLRPIIPFSLLNSQSPDLLLPHLCTRQKEHHPLENTANITNTRTLIRVNNYNNSKKAQKCMTQCKQVKRIFQQTTQSQKKCPSFDSNNKHHNSVLDFLCAAAALTRTE